MAYDAISATNLANWIPSVWSKDVLADVENSLVVGALCDRGYEVYARDGGDSIVVPKLHNLSANVVNTAVDVTWYDAVQNVQNITLNQKYDVAVMVDDINQMQTNPKYFDKVRTKLAYALSKQIDTNCAVQFRSFNSTVGTVNVATTETDLIDAYEDLNNENAPDDGRAWVFPPRTLTDLLKLDYFVKMDYVGDSVVKKGFTGRQIFGSPVYRSTNLDAYAGNAYPAGYFQQEAIALVLQMSPRFEIGRFPARHSDGIIGLAVFGIQVMRSTYGVCINTRGG